MFSILAASGVAIDSAMLQPVVDGATGNIAVILPVAIGLFAILFGVKLIPRIFKLFSKG